MNPTRSTGRNLAATALSAAAALAGGTSAHAAPVNVMNTAGTTLMGVNGIEFNGSSYNVRFVDDTCQAIFSGCNSNANSFLFTTQADALAATNALGAAVFQSALPGAINGLVLSSSAAGILTPFGFAPFGGTTYVAAEQLNISSTTNTNAYLNGPFNVSAVHALTGATTRFQDYTSVTYAQWTRAESVNPLANDVPEPGSLALTAVGLGAAFLAGGKARRRRAR